MLSTVLISGQQFEIDPTIYWVAPTFAAYLVLAWRRGVANERLSAQLHSADVHGKAALLGLKERENALEMVFGAQRATLVAWFTFLAGLVGETGAYGLGTLLGMGLLIWYGTTNVRITVIARDGDFECLKTVESCKLPLRTQHLTGTTLRFAAHAAEKSAPEAEASRLVVMVNGVQKVCLEAGWPSAWSPISNGVCLESLASVFNEWCEAHGMPEALSNTLPGSAMR